MICPECKGELSYVEELTGSFVNKIDSDGFVDWDNKEFYGDSHSYLECFRCNSTFNYEYEPNQKIILIEEE